MKAKIQSVCMDNGGVRLALGDGLCAEYIKSVEKKELKMKCTCVQCGKTFELNDSEIEFYRKKNLHLPKRCKECRQKNKQKSSPNAADNLSSRNSYNGYNAPLNRKPDNKNSKWIYAVIAVAVLLLILGIKVSRNFFDTYVDSNIYSEESTQYSFRNTGLLEEHYQKHGVEMGFSSSAEYQMAANAVVNNENSLHKLEAEDGDDVYYLVETNDFVIVSTDGYIRTYFRPDGGINYYNKQ
ncbi:MAG: zinc-ribbon domain containing protein [Butyrivibrio sp.]|nr:zinc-ribbon domain containing protein [Butyrivibrio sp.]